MQAFEFHATIKNGAIEIPPEHLAQLHGNVTVIVVPNEPAIASSNMIDRLLVNPLRDAGFKPMTREELHAR